MNLPIVAGLYLYILAPLAIKAWMFYEIVDALFSVVDFTQHVWAVKYAQPVGLSNVFDAIAGKFIPLIKVLLTTLVFVIFTGLLVRASESAFNVFLSFLSVAVLGSAGFVGGWRARVPPK